MHILCANFTLQEHWLKWAWHNSEIVKHTPAYRAWKISQNTSTFMIFFQIAEKSLKETIKLRGN